MKKKHLNIHKLFLVYSSEHNALRNIFFAILSWKSFILKYTYTFTLQTSLVKDYTVLKPSLIIGINIIIFIIFVLKIVHQAHSISNRNLESGVAISYIAYQMALAKTDYSLTQIRLNIAC